ncbi:MAG: PA domain-containing protein [Actinomycetota bacterium]
MTARLSSLATATVLVLSLTGGGLPANAADFLPYVTVDTAPDGAKVMVGEHFEAAELSNSRPLSQGAVGPLPVFYADDDIGCDWTTALSSGISEWIALAQRSVATGSDHCGPFQQKMAVAQAAGADALILINNAPGTAAGTAAGTIPGGIIDQVQGERLRDSLSSSNPSAVKISFGLLDSETFLPLGTIFPTAVNSLTATQSGGVVNVSGKAAFGGQFPVTVTEDPAGDAPVAPQLGEHTGVDLVAARMYQPAPDAELVVEWKVTNLPASGGIPEGTRYSLPFKIGTKEFQVQAKFSNLGSVTTADDPPGHATHAGATFQLRGNCTTSYQGTGVAACPHLGWLTGEYDVANDTVRVRIPLGASFAPEIAPGARLERNTSSNANLNMVIAGYQAFVALSPTTNDEAFFGPDDSETYAFVVPTKEVTLGVAPAGTDPGAVSYTTAATLAGNDSFTGNVSTSGLAPGSYEVFARACFGNNCATRTAPFTI